MSMKSSLALLFALFLGTAASAQTLSQVFAFGCPGIIEPCVDGAEPGSIIQASDGNIYGLSSSTDGNDPLGVIQASNGNLYRTAEGYTPTIFRVNPATGQYTVLYTYAHGSGPMTSLIEASNGLLYGLSSISGTGANLTVYSMTSGGNVQTLGEVQCSQPRSSGLFVQRLHQASDGNLWGVCGAYGTNATYGDVFSVSLSGALVATLPFNHSNGAYPEVGVIQANSGVLYGTTFDGGTDAKGNLAFGNVYAVSGLPPVN